MWRTSVVQSRSWDYIVVGAGSAGCVVVNRLTEDPDTSVLLLEAGGRDDAAEIRVPMAFAALFKTRWDWNYHTVAQPGLDGRALHWPRMKSFGGCSAMNAMIYIRGNREDYDRWRDDFGAIGWSYDEVLPYFIRAEANTRHGEPHHGRRGPLRVEERRYTAALSRAWVEAAVAHGFRHNADFNAGEQTGVGTVQLTCRRGRRWSAADAYLRPAMRRPNLTVRSHALATRVVLEGDRAVGVAYLCDGQELVARAQREVILAGGVINSPQVLMLSGIGPADHLRELAIGVAVELPGVGANLHDHTAVPLVWRTAGAADLAVDGMRLRRLARWRLTGGGMLASNVAEAAAFYATRPGRGVPDVQLYGIPTGFYDPFTEPVGRMFTAGVSLVDVASRGRLRLRSADPRWAPLLDPGYYTDDADMKATVAACRLQMAIAQERPLQRYLTQPWLPEAMDHCTDRELRHHIRRHTLTGFHPVGTCAMGSGPGAVVDPELRVHGVSGLRVVDASVIPTITRGNTYAPVVMIAEKAADLIRSGATR